MTKQWFFSFLYGIFCLILTAPIWSQDSLSIEREPYVAIRDLVEKGRFSFEATSINPRTGPQVSLVTNDNYVHIDEDKVTAYLPYFGVARGPDYNGTGPIIINGVVESSSLVVKKKRFIYKFKTNGPQGSQDIYMNIARSGWTTMVVRSVGRPSISYYGKIRPLKSGIAFE